MWHIFTAIHWHSAWMKGFVGCNSLTEYQWRLRQWYVFLIVLQFCMHKKKQRLKIITWYAVLVTIVINKYTVLILWHDQREECSQNVDKTKTHLKYGPHFISTADSQQIITEFSVLVTAMLTSLWLLFMSKSVCLEWKWSYKFWWDRYKVHFVTVTKKC